MRINQLIDTLESMKKAYGDVPVVISMDPDKNYFNAVNQTQAADAVLVEKGSFIAPALAKTILDNKGRKASTVVILSFGEDDDR